MLAKGWGQCQQARALAERGDEVGSTTARPPRRLAAGPVTHPTRSSIASRSCDRRSCDLPNEEEWPVTAPRLRSVVLSGD